MRGTRTHAQSTYTQSHLILLMREMKLFQTCNMRRGDGDSGDDGARCVCTYLRFMSSTSNYTRVVWSANQDSILCENENSVKSALKINFPNSSFSVHTTCTHTPTFTREEQERTNMFNPNMMIWRQHTANPKFAKGIRRPASSTMSKIKKTNLIKFLASLFFPIHFLSRPLSRPSSD